MIFLCYNVCTMKERIDYYMIKALLFDLDGTLIDTNELILMSFRHTFKELLNLEVEDREITRLFGEPLTNSMMRYNSERAEELTQFYRNFNESIHDIYCKPFKGVTHMLKKMKDAGIKTAVVTSKRRTLAERGMKLVGIYEFMDVIITPEDTDMHKPNPHPALKAMELLGVKPEETIMVGDSNLDILCGKNAGCKTCGVTYTALPIELLQEENPDYMIDSLCDLYEIVNVS